MVGKVDDKWQAFLDGHTQIFLIPNHAVHMFLTRSWSQMCGYYLTPIIDKSDFVSTSTYFVF